jgi:hypothetical protein
MFGNKLRKFSGRTVQMKMIWRKHFHVLLDSCLPLAIQNFCAIWINGTNHIAVTVSNQACIETGAISVELFAFQQAAQRLCTFDRLSFHPNGSQCLFDFTQRGHGRVLPPPFLCGRLSRFFDHAQKALQPNGLVERIPLVLPGLPLD